MAIQWDKAFAKAHLHKRKDYRLGEAMVLDTLGEAEGTIWKDAECTRSRGNHSLWQQEVKL